MKINFSNDVIIFICLNFNHVQEILYLFGKFHKGPGEFLVVTVYGCLSILATGIPAVHHVVQLGRG